MPCPIKNPANYDLRDLEPHVHGMYDHFASKYGFHKPPVMVFDSEPNNQSKVLGKTAYYDPQSFEIHVFVDGRHPKDVLRSIAHELIHHRQNLEGRLDVGGYTGPGYYLENDNLKEVEHEAMLEGNATMREYEDTRKYKENKDMSLKEWKNNELNQLLLKKFGILNEKLGDGETQPTDSVEAGLDNNKEFTRSDLAAEKGGARGDDKKKPNEDDKKNEELDESIELEEELDEASCGTHGGKKRRMEESDEGKLEESLRRIINAKKIVFRNKRVK
jgi:hypothetical protein